MLNAHTKMYAHISQINTGHDMIINTGHAKTGTDANLILDVFKKIHDFINYDKT